MLDAAKEKKVWGIGVDADQCYLGPQVLTSAEKKVDRAVFLTIKDVKDGTFKGGVDKVYGLKANGVGLGKISPKVPASEVAKIKQIRAADHLRDRSRTSRPRSSSAAPGRVRQLRRRSASGCTSTGSPRGPGR